ncbi:HEAT repeat-containing protein 3 [Trichonephila inaurata madagascariensis]|uniref:HEAT repeat-containing protein 3 n=1 Tax=Trichonephila inaurata madagascariensis TaxID=2747483 RepID=A0A8X6WSC2_9ARAC|nr:HEAT repeat-containing protein 3 [Trichonephila inaurata madagascariensis]
MGKIKEKKHKFVCSNPIGIPSLKELELEFILNPNADDETLKCVLLKIQSRRVEDRETGAVIVANLANNKTFVTSLLKENFIKIASPLLIDKNLAVRNAVAGCLRNIAACGDYTVSEAMVDQDVMTSLVMLFEQYKDAWTPTKNTDKLDSKVEIFIEACNILWNLCENSDSAVSIFNRKDVVSILIPCLKVETYGTRIPIAVAQCLYTVTENNAKLNEVLRESEAVPLIKNLMSLPATEPEYLLLKTLAAGIKLNMFSGGLNDCMGNVTTSVLEVVLTILQEPINPALELLCKRIVNKGEKFNMLNEEEENIENNLEAIDIASEKIDHLLSTKQISLEILGNIFDDNDEEDEWDDISSSDSEEVVLDDGEMEVDTVTNDFGSVLPPEILEFIMNGKVLEKIIKQIVIPPNEIKEVLLPHSKGKECLKRLDVVRNTALLCLNNVIQKLKVEDLEGPSKLNELWLNLGKLLFETDIADVEQVEAITRSLSAVVRKLAEAKCSSYFSHMTESDLELLINICNKSQDSRIKVHMISILGIIGCLLGNINTPSSAHLIKMIGSVLLEISSKSVDMWVIAEALDALIDVFAEDYVDHIAQEINLVEKLHHILPTLKKGKIKEYRDHQVVITTTKTNLIRFIKYKNKLNRK